MTGAANHRAIIPPVAEALSERPTWSVMIPTYNSARYLGETIASVLAQDPGPARMQIEVVDDGSDDDPAQIVERLGKGRVQFHRQPRNLGQIANFASCLQRSRGHYVHLLHGDDRVRPGYYEAMEAGFSDDPAIGAAFCRWSLIDGEGAELECQEEEIPAPGILPDALARLAGDQRIVTPSIAVRRTVWEQLGGFDDRLKCAEDWEMWVRIASRYAIYYDPRPMAEYRVHNTSTTARAMQGAQEMYFTSRAMQIFAPLLPREVRASVLRSARKKFAARSIERGRALNAAGDRSAAKAHARMALRFAHGPRTWRHAMHIYLGGQ